jgi:hypothetical protein
MLVKEADLDDCVILELEAEPAGDLDFDADQGAMLVIPTVIVECVSPDYRLAREIASKNSGLRK